MIGPVQRCGSFRVAPERCVGAACAALVEVPLHGQLELAPGGGGLVLWRVDGERGLPGARGVGPAGVRREEDRPAVVQVAPIRRENRGVQRGKRLC